MDRRNRIPIEDLLVHARWLRGLVRGLLDDATLADDVVQQTWLAALRSPPRHRRGLRGWLATVARNVVRQIRRREGRRPEKERHSARTDVVPDVTEAAIRLEMHRRVADLVLELKEPYRSAILLRYYEERSPGEIARHLGVPGSTVRNRIRRALERLRTRLDEESGDRRSWALALLPLLDHESSGSGTALDSSPAPSSPGRVPVVALAVLVIVVVLVVLVGLVGLWTLRQDNPRVPGRFAGTPGRASGGVAGTTTEPAVDAGTNRPRPAEVRPSPETDAAERGLVLQGRVISADTRRPLAGAEVVLLFDWWRSRARNSRSASARHATGADGTFAFSELARGVYSVTALHPDFAPRTLTGLHAVQPEAVEPVEAALEDSADSLGSLEGRVWGPDGMPVEGACVTVRPVVQGAGLPTTTGPGGEYRFPRLHPDHYSVELTFPGGVGTTGTTGTSAHVRIVVGRVSRADFGVGASVTGTLTGPDGGGLDGWRLVLTARSNRRYWARTDPDGSFRLTGIAHGVYSVRAYSAEGNLGVGVGVAEVTRDVALALRLPAGEISGRVVPEPGGEPSPRISIAIHRLERSEDGTVSPEPIPIASAIPDGEGRFRCLGLPPGSYRLVSRPRGFRPIRRDLEIDGGRVRLRLALVRARPGRVRLLAVDAVGKPVEGLLVRFRLPGGDWRSLQTDRPGAGVYVTTDLDPGQWELEVSCEGLRTERLVVHVSEGRTTPVSLTTQEAGD